MTPRCEPSRSSSGSPPPARATRLRLRLRLRRPRRPPAPTPYTRDLDRICNVETLVAVDSPGVNPALLTAQYLAANLETQEARDFLARWNGVAAGERATTLDAEAVRAGLTACPTARAWDGK
jgi:hypothetical protein